MQDLDFGGQLAKALKISGLLMAVLCLLLIFWPKDPIVWGLLIGIATGIASSYFMGRRLKQVDIDVTNTSRATAHITLGIVLRLVAIVAVLYFVAWTGWINLYATAAGIFVIHGIFIFLVFAVAPKGADGEGSFEYKSKNNLEGGE